MSQSYIRWSRLGRRCGEELSEDFAKLIEVREVRRPGAVAERCVIALTYRRNAKQQNRYRRIDPRIFANAARRGGHIVSRQIERHKYKGRRVVKRRFRRVPYSTGRNYVITVCFEQSLNAVAKIFEIGYYQNLRPASFIPFHDAPKSKLPER